MQGAADSGSFAAGSVPAERGAYVWAIAISVTLGGLLFGYDWVVIGGARQFYEVYFGLTSTALIGWANSCALVGCLIGSLAAGTLADRFGRRRVLLVSAILFAVSSALTGWAHLFASFIVWRITGGVAIGLSSNIAPLYIAEISPAEIRGKLVSLNQLAIVVGILLAQVVNWRIARPVPADLSHHALLLSWNVQWGWRWMFFAVVAPAAVFICTSIFLPESPRWLLTNHRRDEAKSILERVGGLFYAASEISSIERSLVESSQENSLWADLLRPRFLRVVLIGIALAVLQQWTGINTLFNYAEEVYRSAGYAANDIFLNIVITGAINLIFTVLSMFLVDRIGRRWMMILGCAGIGISYLLCAYAYKAAWPPAAVLTLTLCAIACYALTLAPVTWVLIAEIFPNRIRSHGISIAVSALWIACFLLTYIFPALDSLLGITGTFSLYGIICLLGLLFVMGFVRETKGKTLEQIEADMTVRH
ncbi:sugar porter family MFS transporter [Paracidobacterium acidisoli]|uniref:MFS transporter n=1 Tax=Paracidobacterium acidisoli TaxID=2303751 RepID=A0A372IT95_9BACT|nr:sugar porter family MFS transporter [Paracidobacterium acidisoli]MBT9329509.1 sugar porter family MFS transporter [Paracidobacterium acidisoli]